MSEYIYYYSSFNEYFRMKYNPELSKITIQNLLKVIKGITPREGVISLEWKDFIAYTNIVPIYQNDQFSTFVGTDIDETPVKIIRKFNVVCLYKPNEPNTWMKVLDLIEYTPTEPVLSGGEWSISAEDIIFRRFDDNIGEWTICLRGHEGRPFSRPFAVHNIPTHETPFVVEHNNYWENLISHINKNMKGRHKPIYNKGKSPLLTHNNVTIITPYLYQSSGSKFKGDEK